MSQINQTKDEFMTSTRALGAPQSYMFQALHNNLIFTIDCRCLSYLDPKKYILKPKSTVYSLLGTVFNFQYTKLWSTTGLQDRVDTGTY